MGQEKNLESNTLSLFNIAGFSEDQLDYWHWKANTLGSFSVKSTHKRLQHHEPLAEGNFEQIMVLSCSSKVSCFCVESFA